MTTLFYIYSDTTGNDAIAVAIREDYDTCSRTGKKRLTRARYRKGTRFEWTGFRYLARTRKEAIEAWEEG